MQRLFTTFPNGWPGAALLLLRMVCTLPLLQEALAALSSGTEAVAISLRLIGLVPASLLFLGLYTPVGALLQVILELSLAFAMPPAAELHVTRALVGLALMGLGPGAWSLDSRLYGRKRIEL